MPQKLYIPSCVHQPGHRTGARCCQSCGAQHQFDRWGLTMHEQMAVYQYVYGLKPIGPHGPLADELLASKRQPCRLCEGAGIITLHRGDSWGLCATCEGTGGHWTCSFEEVEALRRLVLQQFPDARVDATPHSFVSPRLVHDLGAGMIVDLLHEPDDAEGVLEREDEFDDECERITQQGELVFSLEWDSGGLGAGGGIESVYRLNDTFAVTSLDDCNPGPFDSLEDALKANGLLNINAATTRVSCSMLSTEELAERLRCDEEGLDILINGETWLSSATGRLQRASSDS